MPKGLVFSLSELPGWGIRAALLQ